MNVSICPASPDLAEAARALAARWALPYAERAQGEFALILDHERLALHTLGPGAPGPIVVDFVGGAVGHRRRFGGGRGQPIAKAAGLKAGENPTILDATAGLGRDGFVFASLGCSVILVERSPVAAALLEDGIRRASEDADTASIAARMHLVHADAVHTMGSLDDEQRPDVVYLDPMFPQRDKSALVKKEMRAFHTLVGADPDADLLLPAALRCARRRVVVKRPEAAPPLAGRAPTLSYPTKKHRFDVYVIAALR